MTATSSNRAERRAPIVEARKAGQYRRRRPRSNRPATILTAFEAELARSNRARIARVAEAAARHGWYDVSLASLDAATIVSRTPHVVRYPEDGTFRVVKIELMPGPGVDVRATLRKIGD